MLQKVMGVMSRQAPPISLGRPAWGYYGLSKIEQGSRCKAFELQIPNMENLRYMLCSIVPWGTRVSRPHPLLPAEVHRDYAESAFGS